MRVRIAAAEVASHRGRDGKWIGATAQSEGASSPEGNYVIRGIEADAIAAIKGEGAKESTASAHAELANSTKWNASVR